mmetsp:Transcript_65901/g.73545  ORF Transcript_65901/g.73545 Transcript_65901/m.73545 type:complete len:129 (-) Transcript_65901:148-534(-)
MTTFVRRKTVVVVVRKIVIVAMMISNVKYHQQTTHYYKGLNEEHNNNNIIIININCVINYSKRSHYHRTNKTANEQILASLHYDIDFFVIIHVYYFCLTIYSMYCMLCGKSLFYVYMYVYQWKSFYII